MAAATQSHECLPQPHYAFADCDMYHIRTGLPHANV